MLLDLLKDVLVPILTFGLGVAVTFTTRRQDARRADKQRVQATRERESERYELVRERAEERARGTRDRQIEGDLEKISEALEVVSVAYKRIFNLRNRVGIYKPSALAEAVASHAHNSDVVRDLFLMSQYFQERAEHAAIASSLQAFTRACCLPTSTLLRLSTEELEMLPKEVRDSVFSHTFSMSSDLRATELEAGYETVDADSVLRFLDEQLLVLHIEAGRAMARLNRPS